MPSDANPYLDLMQGEEDRRATQQAATLTTAVDVNPDQYATRKRVAGYLGYPVAAVEATPEASQREAAVKQVQADTAAHPVLQRRYTDDDFAKLAHDDSGTLSAIGDTLAHGAKYIFSAPDTKNNLAGDISAGYHRAGAGTWGLARAGVEFAAPLLDPLVGNVLPANPLRAAGAGFGELAEGELRRAKAASPPAEGIVAGGVSSGVQSFVGNALLMPLALLGPEGAVATLVGAAGQQGGQAYQDAREKGLTPMQALPFAASQAVIEYATEKLPLHKLIGDIKAGSSMFKTLAHQIAAEVPGEQLATVLQDLNEWAVLPENKDKPFTAYLAERPSAAAQTLIATVIGIGGNVAVMKSVQTAVDNTTGQQRQAQQAEQGAEHMKQLFALAAQSKLRERSPETLGALVQEMSDHTEGAPTEVYVDARTLAGEGGLLNQEKVAELLPSVAPQLAEALATGGDVAIPIGELVGNVAGTPLEQKLLEHLRTTPEGLSQAEAKQASAQAEQYLQSEAARLTADAVDGTDLQVSADKVKAQVLEQLNTANRFTPEVHDAYARLVRDFYTVSSQRLGMTPEAMYQAYPLRVAAVNPAHDAVLNQGDVLDLGDLSSFSAIENNASGESAASLEAQNRLASEKAKDQPRYVIDTRTGAVRPLRGVDAVDKHAGNGQIVVQKNVGAGKWTVLSSGGDVSHAAATGAVARAQSGGTLHQGPRGTFSPSTLQISLLEGADLSTFLHETGHFFLEVLADVSSQPNAPAAIAGDMGALLKWFGVKDLGVWNAMTLDEKRPYHEKFAESFEQYLFEGKAPNQELQPLFQRFRAWLTNVYRSLNEFTASHDTKLTAEVRDVFNRLLASEESIKAAEQARAYAPLFKSAEQAGMTPAEWAAYQAVGEQATERAIEKLETRSVRDMRWASNARSKALRTLQRDAADKRKAVEAEVRAELAAQPVEMAREYLKEIHATSPEDKAALKAWNEKRSAQEVATRETVKAETLATTDAKGIAKGQFLAKNKRAIDNETERRMLVWEKENPKPKRTMHEADMDAAAELFGFSSGDELRVALLESPPMAELLEGMTDQRMLERFGDLTTVQGMQRAADEAVHNDARAKFIATGLRALLEGNTQTEATGKTIKTKAKDGTPIERPQTVNVIVRAARQFAESLVARRKVRDLKPGQHLVAETRAGKLATTAVASGDTKLAITAQRDQLLNHYAARATQDALAEVEKGVGYLRKFETNTTLPEEYRDQIDRLLERFDLRKTPLKTVDKRKSLVEWVESQRAIGVEPELPPGLLNEAQRQSYRDMTVEEFRGLVDAVKQIDHLGRLKDKLLTAKDQRDFEATRDAIAKSIVDNAGDRKADTRTPTTNLGRALQGMRNFGAAHIKAATWARIFDGGKDGGPVWEYFVRSANERGDQETTQRAEATKALSGIMAPVFAAGKLGGKGKFFPSVKRSFNRESLIAIALNTGNAGNLQRLLGGEGWTQAQLQPMLDSLSRAEWETVQNVWDYFDSFRPQIAAKQKRIYGVEPDWVDPVARRAVLPDGTSMELRGGYYPIKYDPAASVRAEEHADAEGAKRQLQGAYGAATTRRSFTKTRAEEVSGRPLLYTLGGMYSGVSDVIHDLAWHEWLIDVNRLLKSQAIDSAIREHYGPSAVRQFKSWRDAVAEGESGAQEALDMALGRLRQGVSVAGLGFNVMSALMQPLGMTQSIVRVGPKWIGKGTMQYIANPAAATVHVQEQSEFMASRARTRFRELNELRNKVQGDSAARTAMQQSAYFLMIQCQQMVDVPTWLGAYEKAIAEGNDDERARALSDQAVIDAQGGGQTKDLSAIERGGPAQKLFTVFYSFMNTALNLGVASKMGPDGLAKFTANMLMLYVVPAVLGHLLKNALTPGDSGEDKDWKTLMRALIGEQLTYLLGLMVVAREFGEAAKNAAGLSDHPRDYSGPAGVRAIADAATAGKQIQQGQFDDQLRKALINLAGDIFALPAAQINRMITGAKALKEGKTHNPAALVMGYQEPH